SKILQLVLESGDKKSKATAFVDRFAKIYTPIVFLLAVVLAIFPPLITCLVTAQWLASTWTSWIFVALTALVIACPCAIVISVPLTYFTGMTLASKGGVIIKGGNYLDRINDIGTVVFDKTGTLTTGKFNIVESNYVDISEEKFKEYVYIGESLSSHPIGEAITLIYNLGISNEKVENYKEIGGKGLKFNYDGHSILVGNGSLFDSEKVTYPDIEKKLTTVMLAVDGTYHGYILLDDTPKETALRTINYLNDHNIKSIILSGAKKESAEYMGNLLGISEVHSELLPNDKIINLEHIIENSTQSVAYVGDGANDAPSIIMSDVGFAMGSIGSDVSVDNADVVIMNDEPIKVAEAMEISHITRRRATLIIAITLTIKAIIFILDLVFAFFDTIALPMWVATLADSGLAIIMIIVAIALLRKKIEV
ncbi:MAG: HAD-IC family P-type ATPase, partial [Coprobacillus sp.]|nr:HAD-IC family P-type ATPase [Coprobacillus sp.]